MGMIDVNRSSEEANMGMIDACERQAQDPPPVLAVAEQVSIDDAMDMARANFHERAIELENMEMEARDSFHRAAQALSASSARPSS